MISLTNISSYAILATRLPTTKYTKKAIKLVDIVANGLANYMGELKVKAINK